MQRKKRAYVLISVIFVLISSTIVFLLTSTNFLNQGCGVTRNHDGSYSFSWLHVDHATGYIMDEHNCIVDLRGFNTAGTEYGDALGNLDQQRLAWFNQAFNMNFIRLNINVTWWNQNVFVPRAALRYRAWIQKFIQWAENNGDYVLLNKTNQFSTSPCGGIISFCPPQNQEDPTKTPLPMNPRDVKTGHYLDQAKAFWKSIVPLYVNDPAILYDQWNELHDLDPQTWWEVQNELISTIRAIHPGSLIMLGGPDYNNTMDPVVNSVVPDFIQPNLVYDWHIYDGKTIGACRQGLNYMWHHWGTESNRQVKFAQTHGHAATFNEWGGCYDYSKYNDTLSSYAVANHVAMAYYQPGNVVNKTWTHLNSNGLLVQAAYARFPPN